MRPPRRIAFIRNCPVTLGQDKTSKGETTICLGAGPKSGKRDDMKMLLGMCLVASIVAPDGVLAGGAAPDPKPLAIAEAILEYCAKFDPAAVATYREQVKLLLKGTSEDVLTKLRKSNEYKLAHGQVVEFLAKVDDHNAKKVCARRVGQNP